MELNELIAERLSIRTYESKIDQILKDIGNLDKDPVVNLDKISKKIEELKELLDKSEIKSDLLGNYKVPQWLQSYQEKLRKIEHEKKSKSFGNELEKDLKTFDLSLKGQYPNLKVGFFSLELDFEKDRVKLWYGYEQELLNESRILAKEVKSKIENFLNHGGSGLPAEDFMNKLKNAYHNLLSEKVENQNVQLPIIQVWRKMASWEIQSDKYKQEPIAKNMRDYSRADFSYDLYKFRKILVEQGFHLTVAVKAYTENPHDRLWIPTNDKGDASLFSFIKFEEKQKIQHSDQEPSTQLNPTIKSQKK